MTDRFPEAIEKLREEMPAIFAAVALDRYTGGGYRWRTLANEKCRGDAPAEIFLRHGARKVLIDRDRFLAFWAAKLSAAERGQDGDA